jgi:diadenosine tetraphosphate (Ap4A) HIT family hydrolase
MRHTVNRHYSQVKKRVADSLCGRFLRRSQMYQTNYDEDNIFAKILKGEIPNDTVYEDENILAFRDVNPQREVHVLVIPRGRYVSFDDFAANAGARGIGIFFNRVGYIAKQMGLQENGYRLIMNVGEDGGQEVPHFHVHILGGEPVGKMCVAER